MRKLLAGAIRLVRADFFINFVVGRFFNSVFSSLMFFYFFVIRHGVSKYLNSGAYKYLAQRSASGTHVRRGSLTNLLSVSAMAVATLSALVFIL